ncbi:hypothetical protein [Streptomyces sp. NPDC101150]|uniref:hypothetical protein n=1 Tax=Streptomyces sp. NPDC101150 TaxID=3366114 RepID=UPI0038233229
MAGFPPLVPPAPLPVRDAFVIGAWGGGLAAHNVVDGKRRWAVRDLHAPSRYLSDRLLAAVDVDGDASLLPADDDAVYVLTKDHRLYEFPEADRRRLLADGNRVFVMNGKSLYALPVF